MIPWDRIGGYPQWQSNTAENAVEFWDAYGLKRKYRCSIREMGFKFQLDCFLFKNLYGKMIPKLAYLLTCWHAETEVRRWWNGPLPVAKMTPVLAVGITTCPALPVSSTPKPPWQISNGSTTAPLRGRTNFAACHRAPVAAGSPVTIASQGIRCMPHWGLAAMATTEDLDVCHPSRPWETWRWWFNGSTSWEIHIFLCPRGVDDATSSGCYTFFGLSTEHNEASSIGGQY